MLAEQFDRTFIFRRQAFEYFDGSGLSGAIGTKQTKALTREHFEIESVDGSDVRKSLYESRAAQRDWPRRRSLCRHVGRV